MTNQVTLWETWILPLNYKRIILALVILSMYNPKHLETGLNRVLVRFECATISQVAGLQHKLGFPKFSEPLKVPY